MTLTRTKLHKKNTSHYYQRNPKVSLSRLPSDKSSCLNQEEANQEQVQHWRQIVQSVTG